MSIRCHLFIYLFIYFLIHKFCGRRLVDLTKDVHLFLSIGILATVNNNKKSDALLLFSCVFH